MRCWVLSGDWFCRQMQSPHARWDSKLFRSEMATCVSQALAHHFVGLILVMSIFALTASAEDADKAGAAYVVEKGKPLVELAK